MTNKPTDEQIKKALECCNIGEHFKICDNCPCCIEGEKAVDCVIRLHTNALDLINRQDAVIEGLKKSLKVQGERLVEERRQKYEQIDIITKLKDQLLTVKSKAYKEFAELVHCQCEAVINQPHNENVRPVSWKIAYEEFDEKVDNLLKELVGEDNTSLDNKKLIK